MQTSLLSEKPVTGYDYSMKHPSKKKVLSLLVLVASGVSCAQGMVSVEEDHALQPMLAVPDKPFGPLDTKEPRKDYRSNKKPTKPVYAVPAENKRSAQDINDQKKKVFENDPKIPLVQGKETEATKDKERVLRSELVQSATRLLGVEKSFDDRSFIGHILKVCGLTGPNADTNEILAEDLFQKKTGKEITKEEVLPGDLLLFKCPNGCGAQTRKGVGAGIVVRVLGDCVEFITYMNHKVVTAYFGTECQKKVNKSRIIEEILGFLSLAKPGPT